MVYDSYIQRKIRTHRKDNKEEFQKTKEDKGHTHQRESQPSYIGGDMDIVYKGEKASVKAHIYPRKIK